MGVIDSKEMTDEQLLQGCIRNDASAQKGLYDKFSRKMFGVCLRYASNREEAEDLLQEGFVKVFQNLSSFNSEGSFEGWIRRIMVNTALDFIRRQKLVWSDQEIEDDQLSGDDTMEKLGVNELLKLINALPPGFRTVFNLYAIEGYQHKEIGQLLGISENTSKSQFARARTQLAKQIQEMNQKTNTIHS
jgi:RNA polymerase sigma-70 factor (ECF subfamily)